MTQWTIKKLLDWITDHLSSRGIDSPRLTAELLLSYILQMQRIELYTHFNTIVEKASLDKLHELVSRAGQNEPVAYLIGRCEFYSIELEITPDCLIPRPETELLVEKALEFLRSRKGPQLLCDLCTGSGCIAVAIAKNYSGARIIATDISEAALQVAARNVKKYNLENQINLLSGDLFEPVVPHLDNNGFDLIVCNPPYVSTDEFKLLDENIRNYEPPEALLAGADGLDFYRKIAEQAADFLKADSALMLETGFRQAQAVTDILKQTGFFTKIGIEKDPQGNDRLVTAHK
ncbi:MAG: peptide chain release factor N(5)-glutamine methyltransferase [Planctomycetota bacterium]|jgi:release factor glutamine methyltransferase